MSLNLFDIPNIDYRYEAKRWIPFKPANTGTRPILFTVPAGDDYYDLNETKLEIKVRMNTTGTGGLSNDETGASDGNDTKYVYCVNNFGHSLFNQMNVSFNGVLMTEQSNAYHQKAYLETLQNFNRQEGETTLTAQGWVNELNVLEELTPTNAGNNDKPNPNNWSGKTGLKALTSRLIGKAYHTFIIKPHIAVFKTGKCLVPNVQIDLELYLNDSNMFDFLGRLVSVKEIRDGNRHFSPLLHGVIQFFKDVIPHGVVVECLECIIIECKPTHLTLHLAFLGKITIIPRAATAKFDD